MEILIGIVMYYSGRKLFYWYGYEKGRKDALYWKPIHDNRKIFFAITTTSILLMLSGIGLIIYKIFRYIF
jgi:hypothetical protein